MNCTRCNALLIPEARFCPVCGLVVSTGVPQPAIPNTAQTNQPVMGESPTVPTPPLQAQQPAPFQPQYMPPQSMPPQAYQPTQAVSPSPGSLPSAGARFPSPPLPMRRRKNLLWLVLLIPAVILLVLVAGWFVALRPYLHGLAQSQIDTSLTSAIIPLEVALIPPGPASVPVTEAEANSFIASNTSSSDPIQQANMTITPAGLRLDFKAYGFPCTVTGVPQVSNGKLVITNVTVQGIAALIMSPDELTTILNARLQNAGVTLHRNVTGVILKDHEMDIQLR